MPRYFFNVRTGHSEPDTEGSELTSPDAARLAAIQLAGEILRDEAHRRKLGDAWCLEASDEAGGIICSVDIRVSVPVAEG